MVRKPAGTVRVILTGIYRKSILKKNKKYYVKVRAYKNYKGKRVYGPYSTVKAK